MAVQASQAKGRKRPVHSYQAQEALSNALSNYSTFTDEQKKNLVVKVKHAALSPEAPQMTPEHARQVADEVKKPSS